MKRAICFLIGFMASFTVFFAQGVYAKGDADIDVHNARRDLKRTHRVVINGREILQTRQSNRILRRIKKNIGSVMVIEPRFRECIREEAPAHNPPVDGVLQEMVCVVVNGTKVVETQDVLDIVDAVKRNFGKRVVIKPAHLHRERHTRMVSSVAFSPNGRMIASGSHDHTIKLWDAQTGEELKTLDNQFPVQSLSFSPNGKKIASGLGDYSGAVKVWDIKKGSVQSACSIQYGVDSVAFHPRGHFFALLEKGSAFESSSGIKLVKVIGKKIEKMRELCVDTIAFEFSPDGTTIASATFNTIALWDVGTGDKIDTGFFEPAKGSINTIIFSSDGNRVASGDDAGNIEIWDLQKRKKLVTLKADGMISSVAFSPDGKRLVAGSDSEHINLWNVETGEVIETLIGHSKRVTSVAFSPDGTQVASGSEDCTVKLWDV